MRLLRDNGLTIVLAVASLATIIGMFLTGWNVYNEELARHGSHAVTLSSYATSGRFLSALFENWESEFLQISAYVVLTAFLFQRGSSRNRIKARRRTKTPPTRPMTAPLPRPVRLGGLARRVYSYSLGTPDVRDLLMQPSASCFQQRGRPTFEMAQSKKITIFVAHDDLGRAVLPTVNILELCEDYSRVSDRRIVVQQIDRNRYRPWPVDGGYLEHVRHSRLPFRDRLPPWAPANCGR
jgi:hypothetical protein